MLDVPEPTYRINDVLIRVTHTGICGTDLHIYDWDEWARQTIPVPMVIGHEFVGEIVAGGFDAVKLAVAELLPLAGSRGVAAADAGLSMIAPFVTPQELVVALRDGEVTGTLSGLGIHVRTWVDIGRKFMRTRVARLRSNAR